MGRISWVVGAAVLAWGCGDSAADVGASQGRPDGATGEESDAQGAGSFTFTADYCFEGVSTMAGPDYDQFMPTVGEHCYGTNHQQVEGVERVVFLGDSVTAGTPPSNPADYFRTKLGNKLTEQFPGAVVDNCSEWGARTDDLLEGGMQIPNCFPDGGDGRTTLVIFTIGGNDMSSWAGDALPSEEAIIQAESAAVLLDDAVRWLTDESRFPNGSYVVFANPYEFTDGTGDLQSCPVASAVVGDTVNYAEGADAVIYFQQRFMEIAVMYGADMVFSFEHFCGHGFHNEDPEAPCYRGPNTERWFDGTCIHPNPVGHGILTELFFRVITE